MCSNYSNHSLKHPVSHQLSRAKRVSFAPQVRMQSFEPQASFIYRQGKMYDMRKRNAAVRNQMDEPTEKEPPGDEPPSEEPEEPNDGELIDEVPIDDKDMVPDDEVTIDDDDGTGEMVPGDMVPGDEVTIDDEDGTGDMVPIVSENEKCSWGPAHYCQSQDVFSTCRSDATQFDSECRLIREGMLAKCEALGKRFWCSSDSNFNYCVASQGFNGTMSNFSACKPTRVGRRKNCTKCGRCITKIYNINSCGCDSADNRSE